MASDKKLNMKQVLLQGKQRAQALPAAQAQAEPKEVAPAMARTVTTPAQKKDPASILSTKKKSLLDANNTHFMSLARGGISRDFPKGPKGENKGETFTFMNELLTALGTYVGADFEADKLNYLLQLGALSCIAYPVKKGHDGASFSRDITDGFLGTTNDELSVLFGDREGMAKIEAMFQQAIEATPK